jgi:adenylosuccinate synthase
MRVAAVIGANWGDEGKGLVVDALADTRTVVVRFNGGAQAGHTVQTPEGRRHVFHHFGSGTLRGAATFLSRFFVVNPVLYREEWSVLSRPWPNVGVDPACQVTTPWDMMINQAVERKRGAARHGSCGVGVNETLARSLEFLGLTYMQLRDARAAKELCRRVRDEYAPIRCRELGLELSDLNPAFSRPSTLTRFLQDLDLLYDTTDPRSWWEVSKAAERVVYEGAQGLRLDRDSADFPYVTPSSTGLTNVVTLQAESVLPSAEVFYVSRSYATRHGAGPLPHELLPAPTVPDPTNVPNEHQGHLRIGRLDVVTTAQTIRRDFAAARQVSSLTLVMTCLDQRASLPVSLGLETVVHRLRNELRPDGLWLSFGPTRATLAPEPVTALWS